MFPTLRLEKSTQPRIRKEVVSYRLMVTAGVRKEAELRLRQQMTPNPHVVPELGRQKWKREREASVGYMADPASNFFFLIKLKVKRKCSTIFGPKAEGMLTISSISVSRTVGTKSVKSWLLRLGYE